MAKRKQRRPRQKAPTVEYVDPEGNTLTLRQSLSPATIAKLGEGPATAATSQEDVWHRRAELLFERLAVRWEIAELPLTEQKMLLGRYRMADQLTQQWVRETIAAHLERYIPELSG
jgi:non-ribosomal peptide synthetase component F